MVVDASEAVAGIDVMIASMERLAGTITAITGEARAMAESLGAAGAGGGGIAAAAAADTAALREQGMAAQQAAVETTALTDAERLAADGARLEAEMAAGLAREQTLIRDSSLAAAQGQVALRNAYMATSTGIVKVADEQKAQMAIQEKSRVSMAAMGAAATKTLVGVGVAMGYSVTQAMHFDSEVMRLYTAAGLLQGKSEDVKNKLLQLGNQFGYTGTEMAKAMYHPVSAGLSLAASLNVVTESARLADIHGAKLEETTYSLSSVMKAYGIAAGDTAHTAALLNAIVGQGDMRFNDFNNSIKNWTSTGQTMGITIQSMGAGLAYLTDRGNNAEVASTRLTMGLSMVTAGSKAANVYLHELGLTTGSVNIQNQSLKATMEKAGLTTNRIAADLKKPDGLYVALNDLKGAFKANGLSAEQSTQIMAKLFGGGRSDKAILALMGNLDQLKLKYHQIGDAVKGYGDISDATMATPQQQWKNLEATLKNLAIAFGTILLPGAVKTMHAVSQVVTPLVAFFQAHQTMGATIGGLVTALGGLAIAIKIAQAVEGLVKGFKMMASALKLVELATKAWTAAQWLLNAAQLDNPLGIIILAIIAVVAAVWYAWNHWKGFRDFIIGAWHAIAAACIWLWKNVLVPAWHGIAEVCMWLWHNVISPMVHGMIAEWKLIAAVIMWWWHNIVEPAFHAVSKIVMDLWTDWIKPALGFIMAEIRLVAAIIMWWWHNVSEPVLKGIGDLWHWLYNNAIKPVIDFIIAYIKTLAAIYTWIWKNIVEPVLKGIGAAWNFFYAHVIKPTIDGIMQYIRLLASIFMWLWHNVIDPVWHGMTNVISSAWNLIKGIFNSMVSSVKWVGNTIASILDWVGKQIGRATGAINSVTSLLGFKAFADGGPVPGPDGAPMMAVVHGGEYVLSREMIANITSSGSSNPVDALSTQQVAIASSGPSSGSGGGTVIIVQMTVQGSIVSQRNLENSIRTAVLQTNIRNPTNQLSLPKGR
jgi:TP901 family phage tail tape measure protein